MGVCPSGKELLSSDDVNIDTKKPSKTKTFVNGSTHKNKLSEQKVFSEARKSERPSNLCRFTHAEHDENDDKNKDGNKDEDKNDDLQKTQ